MKLKNIVISLTLSLASFSAFSKEEIKNVSHFKLNISHIDKLNFQNVEENVLIFKDKFKQIKITSGLKGIQNYLLDLENSISNLSINNISPDMYNYKYDKIQNEIRYYESKLEAFKQTESNKSTVHVGACQIGFTQDYYFNFSFFSRALIVTSSYSRSPGPYPLIVPVEMHAISEFSTLTTTGSQYSYSDNLFNGDNVHGGFVNATSSYNGGLTTVLDMDWRAVSTLSKSTCFEYIETTGTFTPNINEPRL